MARIDVTEVTGFEELNRKLKKLNDRDTRKQVLSIQRRLAKPVQQRYKGNLPSKSGTLGQSVAIKTVAASKSGGNPSIVVRPGKRGRFNGFYKFMVIRKGDRPGSTKRGSRKGLNTVTPSARDRTLSQIGRTVTQDAEASTAKFIQRKIDRLSVV